jgi:methyl-accepting chemotaxis protein
MKFLNNIKISHKILLLTITGLLLCVGFGGNTVLVGKQQIKTLDEIYNGKVIPLDNLRKIQLTFRELEYHMAAVMADIIAPIGSGEHLKQSLTDIEKLWIRAKIALTTKDLEKDKKLFEKGYSGFKTLAPTLEKSYFDEDIDMLEESYDSWLDFKPLIFKTIDKMATAQERAVGEYYQARQLVVSRTNTAVTIVTIAATLLFIIFSYIIIHSIKTPIKIVMQMATKAAGGDLTCKVARQGTDEMSTMIKELNNMIENFRGACGKFSEGSYAVAGHADGLLASSSDLFKSTEKQGSQAEQLAVSLTEIAHTSMDMAENATTAAEATEESAQSANIGKEIVNKTVTGITKLSQSINNTSELIQGLGRRSEEIGDIVSVIQDISDQTNLLALNAAIEAARAGTHGRGFAVVADEVKKLAEKTNNATKDIGLKIKAIQTETNDSITVMAEGKELATEAVTTAKEAEEVLGQIVDSSNKVMETVQRIAAATEEQSTATTQVNNSSEHIAMVVNDTVKLAKEVQGSANELINIAKNLNDQISCFKTKDSSETSEIVKDATITNKTVQEGLEAVEDSDTHGNVIRIAGS